jgi:hypothetical protein
MRNYFPGRCALTLVMVGALSGPAAGQPGATIKPVKGILPSGLGEDVDRDIARARAATARFRDIEAAVAAGYPATDHCVENQPTGGMGFHFANRALSDTTLDVEKPEILVYERMADGSIRLNGVEYVVPIAAWTPAQPPTLMGQSFKRADGLGIWYLHAWIWKPSPSGVFADWNPDVKCR